MANAMEGYGTIFGVSATGDAVFIDVAEVQKISGPSFEGKVIDVSHMLSPDGFDEFKPGMVDPGEIHVELSYTSDDAVLLYGLFRLNISVKITFTDTATWVANGFIKSFGTETPMNDRISCTAVFKVSGVPSFTP